MPNPHTLVLMTLPPHILTPLSPLLVPLPPHLVPLAQPPRILQPHEYHELRFNARMGLLCMPGTFALFLGRLYPLASWTQPSRNQWLRFREMYDYLLKRVKHNEYRSGSSLHMPLMWERVYVDMAHDVWRDRRITPYINDGEPIQDSGLCWEWSGTRDAKGFPVVHMPGAQNVSVHRALWLFANPMYPILGDRRPVRLEPRYCYVGTNCVNPNHFRLVPEHSRIQAEADASTRRGLPGKQGNYRPTWRADDVRLDGSLWQVHCPNIIGLKRCDAVLSEATQLDYLNKRDRGLMLKGKGHCPACYSRAMQRPMIRRRFKPPTDRRRMTVHERQMYDRLDAAFDEHSRSSVPRVDMLPPMPAEPS